MSDQNYTPAEGQSDQCDPYGPSPAEEEAAAKRAREIADSQRTAAIDKPLEQDAYDEGIMGLMGGLGGGLLRGGLAGLGKAAVTGPIGQLAKGVLGSWWNGGGDKNAADGAGGGAPASTGGGGAGGGAGY